jgi:hypothetical protein
MNLAVLSACLRRRVACAATCLLLFVSFQLFAGVPKLHHWIHPDSCDATHSCELTLLIQGQVDTATSEVLVRTFTSVLLPAVPHAGIVVVASDLFQIQSGRAPPLA